MSGKDTSFSCRPPLTSLDYLSRTVRLICSNSVVDTMAEVTEFKTLFCLSLSMLPACRDSLLAWLGSLWVSVCNHVCMGLSLCVHLRECEFHMYLSVLYARVCVCTLSMCVGVCVGRALKLTVSKQPEGIFMSFLTVDAKQ